MNEREARAVEQLRAVAYAAVEPIPSGLGVWAHLPFEAFASHTSIRIRRSCCWATLLLALGLSACGAGGDPAPTVQRQFEVLCGSCHGAQGRGDGPASHMLTPRPRDLGDAEWQDTVGDDYLRKVIGQGTAAVGRSATMPGWGHALDPQQLDAMVIHVRQLRRDP